jgi:DNA-binding NarL/FixJ family response regulator
MVNFMDNQIMQTETQPIQVMIVDDHDMVRLGLIAFLKSFDDLEVIAEAGNGEEAIEISSTVTPQVILMDLMMPHLNGVEAITTIHQQQPEIKIIALTNFGEGTLAQAALQAGATLCLVKSVSGAELVEAIRRIGI